MNDDTINLIRKELLDRYSELSKLGERYDTRPRLAIGGDQSAAPADLYRALFGRPVGTATVTREDGTVWEVCASFELTDVPGQGVVGGSGDEEIALAYLREADAALLACLVDRRPTELERALHDHLKRLGRIHGVVVHAPPPADAEPWPVPDRDEEAWTAWRTEVQRDLGNHQLTCWYVRRLASADLVPVATALEERLDAKFKLGYLTMLAHADSRDDLIQQMIDGLSRTAAFLGLNPIPFADVIAITPIQVLLVCQVAAAHHRRVTPSWAREFLTATGAVVTAGLGFRVLYRSLLRLVATPTLPVKMGLGASVAWLGTQMVGRAAHLHFLSGGRMTPREAARRAAEQFRGDRDLPGLDPASPAAEGEAAEGEAAEGPAETSDE